MSWYAVVHIKNKARIHVSFGPWALCLTCMLHYTKTFYIQLCVQLCGDSLGKACDACDGQVSTNGWPYSVTSTVIVEH